MPGALPLSAADLDRVLFVAATQVNVTECPPNSNAGPKVEDYLRTVGLRRGQPWCAAFLAWCGRTALGARWPVPLTGGCVALGRWAAEAGILFATPQAEDIFLLYFPKRARFAHTGFIITDADAAGDWATIEGNTSGGGSREGWGAFRRARRFGAEDRFIRLTATPAALYPRV